MSKTDPVLNSILGMKASIHDHMSFAYYQWFSKQISYREFEEKTEFYQKQLDDIEAELNKIKKEKQQNSLNSDNNLLE